jgi:hypothetical protein
MEKLTAVGWLALRYHQRQGYLSQDDIAEAKAMEKEQMIEFANEYADSGSFYCNGEFAIEIDAEQYYNETYKK